MIGFGRYMDNVDLTSRLRLNHNIPAPENNYSSTPAINSQKRVLFRDNDFIYMLINPKTAFKRIFLAFLFRGSPGTEIDCLQF